MGKLALTLSLVLMFSTFGSTSVAISLKPFSNLLRDQVSGSTSSQLSAETSAASGDEINDAFVEQSCMTSSEAEEAVLRFSKLLQFRTVSSPTALHHAVEPREFQQLHDWMPRAYPEVWETMEVERLGSGNFSLLLRWPGTAPDRPSQPPTTNFSTSSSSSRFLPVLFISHLDVVPVPPETLDQWEQPPFSGAVAGGFVWGRGALDVKVGVSGLLEAATLLIREGWRPQRTLYFAFGQDEEVGGELGAAATAQLLTDRGVVLDMVYDEGGTIGVDGFPPYTTHPIALVGTAEKGYATVLVQITTAGGHSSRPPLDGSSAAAIAARIITSLDRTPPPVALRPPVTSLLAVLARSMPPGFKRWLFEAAGSGAWGPVVGRLVAAGYLARDAPETAALVRTTAAVTGLTSGIAENVLPPAATVRVNFRLLPGFNETDLMNYLNRTVGRDIGFVTFTPSCGQSVSLATPVTPATSPYLTVLRTAIQEVYQKVDGGGAVDVAPTLMPGGTDSKHYLPLSTGGALRHVPTTANKTAGDLARVHGLNERVSVADFGRAVCVYRRLMQLVAGG